MKTTGHHAKKEEDDSIESLSAKYPESTVDALYQQGKDDEAKAELVRLVMEGVNSGPGVEYNEHFWPELHREIEAELKADRRSAA